ncbi:MAG TPA: type ISP restriction/modification enzyme [Fimbriimonas sp.]|nr:type ISP restriction/modification enzyme [Fimbriimonas sp.]
MVYGCTNHFYREMLTESHLRTLLSINTIEDLLAFLCNELHWPIEADEVDDVTFGYEPEELGLKPEHAPKINKIYQIRPPAKDTPWGIFFIDFENKKLPVSLLRRILNHLRVKKHGTVGQSWNADDLMFVSTFGEMNAGMREVAFAHFHQTPGDLPTLNVVQWDGADTHAKINKTYFDLKRNLGWPENTTDKEAWRQQWSAPFKHRLGHTIRTSAQLAEKLAELSRKIRDNCAELLDKETEAGPLTKLYKAFQSALIHDLKPEDFADTFAQTVAYGLFSAAVSRRYPEEKGSKSLTTDTISQIVPETSPFLREVLETFIDVGGRKKGGIDFDELGVQDVVDLLRSDETDMQAVLADFGNRTQGEDPVIHFYEHYLKAYNKELKVKRGVFYTPQPVVSYIVRSVHELLQTEFGLEDGLASTITWGEMAAKNPEIKIPQGTPPDSHFVVVLDPATGTATFLVEVIDVIHKHLQNKWKSDRAGCIALLPNPNAQRLTPNASFQAFWNDYVPDHLLPRLFGYELMMAPYAIAHMKVGLKLVETQFDFSTLKSTDRVRIYLTNSLEAAQEPQPRLITDWPALAHEALAVKDVKETQRFTLVIGNPPYSGHSANSSKDEKGNRTFIGKLVEDYKRGCPELFKPAQAKWLQDDYVKFLRFGQHLVQETGMGALGFITNHGYLDNPTFRGMRRSFVKTYGLMRFLDLHGNAKKKEVSPDGTREENVFDIMQGVAVCILVRNIDMRGDLAARVSHADLYGTREKKYVHLSGMSMTAALWEELLPNEPSFLFAPQDQTVRADWELGWRLPDIFSLEGDPAPGVVTTQDEFAISFSASEAEAKVDQLLATSNEAEAREIFRLCSQSQWNYGVAKKELAASNWRKQIVPILYRPFDQRWTVYDSNVAVHRRDRVMRHMLAGKNLGLITARSNKSETMDHAFVTSLIMETKCGESTTQSTLLPLYRFLPANPPNSGILQGPNLSPAFVHGLANSLALRFEPGRSPGDHGGLFAAGELLVVPKQETLEAFGGELSPAQGSLITAHDPAITPSGPSFSPEDVFHYIYAVLHSLAYRSRYAEFLKIDFPRIPLPGGPEVFDALVPLGAELVALHLMEFPRLDQHLTTFVGGSNPQVEKVSYSNETVWLNKAQTTGFTGVPEEVWNFHIGGYQVCEKWLKDRGPKRQKPGRTLTPEDIDHYHRIVVALSETIRIMKEIDEVIEAHGGWPGAFQSGNNT